MGCIACDTISSKFDLQCIQILAIVFQYLYISHDICMHHKPNRLALVLHAIQPNYWLLGLIMAIILEQRRPISWASSTMGAHDDMEILEPCHMKWWQKYVNDFVIQGPKFVSMNIDNKSRVAHTLCSEWSTGEEKDMYEKHFLSWSHDVDYLF